MNTLDKRFFSFTPVFRMGGGRKKFTIALLAISIALNLVDIAIATDYRRFDNYVHNFTATLGFFIFLLTAFVFLLWFHRVYNNLPLLGAEGLQYTPGWTVGGFIIPFLGFVIPYLIMKEVWKASSPTDYGLCKSADWKNAPVTFVVLGCALYGVGTSKLFDESNGGRYSFRFFLHIKCGVRNCAR